MPVTLKDIAETLHMNKGSVSRVLRNDPRAAEFRLETREKIFRTAFVMGYKPNISAATISTGVNLSTVAIISETDNVSSHSHCFIAIEALNARKLGARTFCGNDLHEIFKDIAANQIPNVICGRYNYKDRILCAELARKYGMRMIFWTALQEFPDFPTFDSDNRLLLYKIITYLHGLGHKRIAFYCGPHEKHTANICRHQGFLDALRDCKIPFEPGMIICDEFSEKALLRCLQNYQPTAICATNPGIAIGILVIAMKYNIRVPKDLSVAAYGKVSENPFTSTMKKVTFMDEYPFANRCSDMFEYFFQNDPTRKPSEYSRFYDGQLVVQESTAPPNPSPQLKKKLSKIIIEPKKEMFP